LLDGTLLRINALGRQLRRVELSVCRVSLNVQFRKPSFFPVHRAEASPFRSSFLRSPAFSHATSYALRAPAKPELGLSARHEHCLRKNNRAENSHHSTRRRNEDAAFQIVWISPAPPVHHAAVPTLSTSNEISLPAAPSVFSATRRSGRGELRRQHELQRRLADFESLVQVHVTAPYVDHPRPPSF
jgi:hypothetical protein